MTPVKIKAHSAILRATQESTKVSQAVIAFDGTWWDTLSREEQLEYIKKHKDTMKKAKPLQIVNKIGTKLKAAGSAASAAYIKALEPDDKKALQNAVVKVDQGQPEKLSEPERSVYKKIGMASAIEMLLVVGSAIALGPILAPVIASMYLSWKLNDGGLGDKDTDPLRTGFKKKVAVDYDDFKHIDDKQRAKIKKAQLEYNDPDHAEEEPEESAEDQKAKVKEADDAAKKKAEDDKKTIDVDAKEVTPNNRQPLTNEGDDAAPKDWTAGTKQFRADTDPAKPVKTKAEPVADKDAKKRPKRFANKAPKELTDSEMGDAIVADFQAWLDSEGPDKVAKEAEEERVRRKAERKAIRDKAKGIKPAAAKKAPAKKKKAAPVEVAPIRGKKARSAPVEPEQKEAPAVKRKRAAPKGKK